MPKIAKASLTLVIAFGTTIRLVAAGSWSSSFWQLENVRGAVSRMGRGFHWRSPATLA